MPRVTLTKIAVYPAVILGAAAATLLATGTGASAHGYVSAPPSRQALCAQRAVPDCGPIQFEPQSVEGPKGLKRCDGGLPQFSVLADESRNWPARPVGRSVTFTWVFTARHRTSNWEYFIGGTKVATVDGGNQQPAAVVSHQIDLSRFPGRRTLLAVWNIGDTPNAFYNCVDLVVGGGGGQTPPPAQPTGSPTATGSAPAPPPGGRPPGAPPTRSGDWAPGTAYRVGDVVSNNGQRFSCRQAHTSIRSWEPSIFTLALWLPV
jgi:chitin-binding protein